MSFDSHKVSKSLEFSLCTTPALLLMWKVYGRVRLKLGNANKVVASCYESLYESL